MAENAGHLVVLEVSPDGTSFTEIDDVKSVQIGRDRTMLEITGFKDTTGVKRRIAGLKDGKVTMSGFLNLADSGQSQLRSRLLDGAACHIGVKWDGSAGTRQKVKGLLSKYSERDDVHGAVEFTCEVEFSGAFA